MKPMGITITGYIREVGSFAVMVGKGRSARGVVLETADGDVTITGLRPDICKSFTRRMRELVTIECTTDSGAGKQA